MGFGQALGFAFIVIGLVAGFFYWIRFVIKKINPNLKYDFKYKVLRRKYNEKDVKKLLKFYERKIKMIDLIKYLLVKKQTDPKRVKELCYIYKQIQLKGGNEDNGR